MSIQISTFFKEDAGDSLRAEVHKENDGYSIHYYDVSGTLFKTENYQGKSLQFVENAAENWTMGIKNLNG